VSDSQAMDLQHALTTTRAVRKRLDLARPVDREVVLECLRLAFQAPNGSNGQLWAWVLVDDADVKAKMAAVYATAMDEYAARPGERVVDYSTPEAQRIGSSVYHLRQHMHEVPVLVVPLYKGRMERGSVFDQASGYGSVLPAVWSFMLALRERGLGSAWTTIHLNREQEMAELLGIPDEYTQTGLFPVAYTIGTDFKPADRSASEQLVYWNRFGEA
jgi:nitroreductase